MKDCIWSFKNRKTYHNTLSSFYSFQHEDMHFNFLSHFEIAVLTSFPHYPFFFISISAKNEVWFNIALLKNSAFHNIFVAGSTNASYFLYFFFHVTVFYSFQTTHFCVMHQGTQTLRSYSRVKTKLQYAVLKCSNDSVCWVS